MMTVWICVDNSKQIGDPNHLGMRAHDAEIEISEGPEPLGR